MVVIAIIGLLAAILFPVFARARENARRSSCQNNLKQIGLGIIMYYQDYDEQMVPSKTDTGGSWRTLIQPYAKNTQLIYCPSRNSPATGYDGTRISYAGNYMPKFGDYARGAGAFGDQVSIPIALFVTPASTIAVCEYQFSYQFTVNVTDDSACDVTTTNSGSSQCIWAGHLGTGNFLFIDGHVKALRPSRTSDMWRRDGSPMPAANDPYFCTGNDCQTAVRNALVQLDTRFN